MVAAVESPKVTASPAPLDWHIVLETLADGQVAAWIAEWPDCRVTAVGREEAIGSVKQSLADKLEAVEVVSFPIPFTRQTVELASEKSQEHPVMKFVGALKDDPDFNAWADEFWAEKQRSHDDEEILSVEDCLKVM
jgi:broad specificity phosphatase PhoE